MNFAHEQNITLIMVCKHIRSRFREYLARGLADEIIRHSGEIDVYVLTDDPSTAPKQEKKVPVKRKMEWGMYAISIAIVGFATVIDTLLFPYVHPSNLIMMYIFG